MELLEKQQGKIKRGISRLIDSYTQEDINKEEFEPRIKLMKQNLTIIEEQKKKLINQQGLKNELRLIVTNLEDFASKVNSGLEAADWNTKRDIIRTLVKRVEINNDEVNVVFRVKELLPISNKDDPGQKESAYCRKQDKGKQSTTHAHKIPTHPLGLCRFIICIL